MQQLAEASVEDLLTHTTGVVHQLEADALRSALREALASGRLIRAPFLFRHMITEESVFLVQSDQGPAHAFRRLEEYRAVGPSDVRCVARAIFEAPE